MDALVALTLAALLIGFALGIAWDHLAVNLIRSELARRRIDQGSIDQSSLRHTVDHICSPPCSRWSSGYEYCFVDDYEHKRIRPADVWVCSECSATWMVEGNQWRQKEEAIL